MDREIRNAHKALIEPTPEQSLPAKRGFISSQQQSPGTPSTSRSNIKRSKTSIERPKVKKPLKRYGSHNHDVFEFRGESDGEVDSRLHEDMGNSDAKPKRHVQNAEAVKPGTSVLSSGDTEVIASGDRYISKSTRLDRETMLQMPPPAMKPTSFEQTQQLELNTAPKTDSTPLTWTPTSLKSVEDTRSLKLTYSDDRVPTPTMSSRGRSDEGCAADTDSIDGPLKRPRLDVRDQEEGQVDLLEPSSSASIISPSKTITVTKATVCDRSIGDDEFQSPERVRSGDGTINPIVLLPQLAGQCQDHDELSLSISDHEPEFKNRKNLTSHCKGKEPDELVHNELGSEDAAMGLPKDQYQPRASKSRSSRGHEEVVVPIDGSKTVEVNGRKKRKLQRRKTTAFHELTPKDEDDDDEEIEVVTQPNLEIPKHKARKVLVESDEEDPDVNDVVGGTQGQPQTEREPAAKPQAAKKQRGRPKKGANEPVKDKAEDEMQIASDDKENELQEDFTVSNTKENASEEKPIGSEQLFAAAAKPMPAPKTKKGRKKSKVVETPAAISEELVRDSDDELAAVDIDQGLRRRVLDEKDVNTMQLKPVEKTAASPPPPNTMQPPPETPRKVSSATPKGPDKHSPISSGKVAYRVGLSKRARIAPLLRVVRK